jgi:hypothetical protein
MRILHSQSLPISLEKTRQCEDKIILITQFFIHKDSQRNYEIKYCLQKNCDNHLIDTIYLLNERIYTPEELGVSNTTKIIQINIQNRIRFKTLFDEIETQNMNGIIIAVNSDIMLDDSIEKIKYSTVFLPSHKKTMITLLRYEYTDDYVPFDTNCSQSKLFGPRGDSQDTWIIHSRNNIPKQYRNLFDFQFGIPGCDNKCVFLFHFLGYDVYNDPLVVKTYHFHKSKQRDYTIKDQLPFIYETIIPYSIKDTVYTHVSEITNNYTQWNFSDNTLFYNTLKRLFSFKTPFIIPAVNNLTWNNKYYDEVFSYCEYYFSRDGYHEEMDKYGNSESLVSKMFPTKQKVWESVRNIIYFIFHTPWTLALEGKRILIISPYSKEIASNTNKPILPTDLLRNNLFSFLHWNASIDPAISIMNTRQALLEIKDNFDIALVDAGDFTNPVLSDLYKIGKSAISMEDNLCLLFGLYKDIHLTQHADFFKVFLNQYWLKVV